MNFRDLATIGTIIAGAAIIGVGGKQLGDRAGWSNYDWSWSGPSNYTSSTYQVQPMKDARDTLLTLGLGFGLLGASSLLTEKNEGSN